VNWEAIGAVGELLSAIAVLITLVYVAYQVRNARKELQQTILGNRDIAVRELMFEAIRNPLLNEADAENAFKFRNKPRRVHARIKEMTSWPDEKVVAFSNYQVAWWFQRVQTVRDISELSLAQKNDFESNIIVTYSDGLEKIWWEEFKKGRSSDDPTVKYCEAVLERYAQRDDT
jgi:hypothetical protein